MSHYVAHHLCYKRYLLLKEACKQAKLNFTRMSSTTMPKTLPRKLDEEQENAMKSHKLFKWAVLGVMVAGASYCWALNRYRVAHCSENKCPSDVIKKNKLDLDLIEALKVKLDKDLFESLRSKVETASLEWWNKVQDLVLEQKMKEAFSFILLIIDSLKNFDKPEVEYNFPRLILLGLVKRAQEHRAKSSSVVHHKAHITPENFEDSKRIGQFALNTYAASWAWMGDTKGAAKKMGLTEDDTVIYTWFSDKNEQDFHCPKFMIFTDEATKSIILAVRGTYSMADVVVDVVCDETPFLYGYAHRGILNGAERILKESGEALREALDSRPDYRLVITGHSLGAGTSILMTMALWSGLYPHILKHPHHREIKCVALAPPPVYRSKSAWLNLSKSLTDKIEIYINGNDCVPRLSLANLAKLMAMCRAVDRVPMSVQDHIKILAGLEDPEVAANLDRLVSALATVNQEKFPMLEHHGKIYYMRKGGENEEEFGIFSAPGDFFSDSILLLENMVAHHLQPYYEEAFSRVKVK